MSEQSKQELLDLLTEQYEYKRTHRLTELFYQDNDTEFDGLVYPRRELYPKHMQFFRAGKRYFERVALSGNQVGKTEGLAGYETALHATKLYPKWWEGHTYNKGISMVCSGNTAQTTADIVQGKLIGKWDKKICREPGLVPPEMIISRESKPGGGSALARCWVEDDKSYANEIIFRSYEQGRKSAEGLTVEWVWIDEEPPRDFFNEIKIRALRKDDARIVCSFTPLEGFSHVVQGCMKDGVVPQYDPDLI